MVQLLNNFSAGNRLNGMNILDSLREWLCHSDAGQVSDLPIRGLFNQTVFDRYGSKTRGERISRRQVRDLPRIRVAEPLRQAHRNFDGSPRSQVCRYRLNGFGSAAFTNTGLKPRCE